jgi:Bacterial virulence protein (VirJ)
MRLSLVWLALIAATLSGSAPMPRTITLRGRPQTLHLYGPPHGYPVIVSSGDGGWIHLAPHVAQMLAARGFAVTGFDVKAYLASFTKPILIGVSEGAGLSVLATSDPLTKAEVQGIVAVGLPDLNELGWRWEDAMK